MKLGCDGLVVGKDCGVVAEGFSFLDQDGGFSAAGTGLDGEGSRMVEDCGLVGVEGVHRGLRISMVRP